MGTLTIALLAANLTGLCDQAHRPDVLLAGGQPLHRYEWRASTFCPSAQEDAALTNDADGNLIAVWASRRQHDGRYGVYGQRFDRDGVAIGREACLSLWTQSHQMRPAVAVGPDGAMWAVWQSFRQDGDQSAIIARRFTGDWCGESEIAVNTTTAGDQTDPVVAIAPDGRVAVAWTSARAGRSAVRARVFAADGSPLGDDFRVATPASARDETIPSIACVSDGSFAVAFAVTNADHKPDGIRLRRLSATGRLLGDEISVCGEKHAGQIEPQIAATRDGFVVTWLDAESDGSDYGVLARVFDAAAAPRGPAFVVNQAAGGSQNAAAVTATPEGGFVVAWNSADGDKSGVFARRFDAAGRAAGGEFRISRWAAGKQELAAARGAQRLVALSDGRTACAWRGNGGRGDKDGIHVTMLSPAPIALAGREQGVTVAMRPATELILARADGPQPHEPPTFDASAAEPDAEREFSATAAGDFGFSAVTNTGWTPPDPHLSVGPDHVVVMTNGAIAFYTKAGVNTFQDQIEGAGGFWGGLGATGFVFDPETLYDELSGRFFAMASEYISGSASYILIAVSDDSDPNGNWHKYRLNTTSLAGDLFDSPNIAVDSQAVYITGDGFPGAGANYPVFIYDKASLLAGNPPAITRSFLLATSTQSAGIPPVSFDSPPALYMIEHQEAASNTAVRLIALRNPLTTPTTTTFTLTVPSYGPPEDPPQQGTSVRPETFDARFWTCAYRKGSLWATHHINSSRVLARWYQINMNGWPTSGNNPALVQSGNMDLGASVRTFFTSITAAANGSAAMTFARTSSTEFISMSTAWRAKTDPLGTMGNVTTRKTNTAGYTTSRWGDYSAAAVDPVDHRTFWAVHEYAIASSWRTWVQRFAPPLPLGDTNCDGSVNPFDIQPFIVALTNPADYASQYPNCDISQADVNGDGTVNPFDITPFINLLGP